MTGNDIRKLNRLKAEQIAKSKKNELFKFYIDSSKNLWFTPLISIEILDVLSKDSDKPNPVMLLII